MMIFPSRAESFFRRFSRRRRKTRKLWCLPDEHISDGTSATVHVSQGGAGGWTTDGEFVDGYARSVAARFDPVGTTAVQAAPSVPRGVPRVGLSSDARFAKGQHASLTEPGGPRQSAAGATEPVLGALPQRSLIGASRGCGGTRHDAGNAGADTGPHAGRVGSRLRCCRPGSAATTSECLESKHRIRNAKKKVTCHSSSESECSTARRSMHSSRYRFMPCNALFMSRQ